MGWMLLEVGLSNTNSSLDDETHTKSWFISFRLIRYGSLSLCFNIQDVLHQMPDEKSWKTPLIKSTLVIIIVNHIRYTNWYQINNLYAVVSWDYFFSYMWNDQESPTPRLRLSSTLGCTTLHISSWLCASEWNATLHSNHKQKRKCRNCNDFEISDRSANSSTDDSQQFTSAREWFFQR